MQNTPRYRPVVSPKLGAAVWGYFLGVLAAQVSRRLLDLETNRPPPKWYIYCTILSQLALDLVCDRKYVFNRRIPSTTNV